MKAISTRALAPTDTKGLRIKAYDLDGNSVTIPDPDLPDTHQEARYAAAAVALCRKMEWSGPLLGGAVKDGYVFVFVSDYTHAV